jgi:putative RecB family exonuclease
MPSLAALRHAPWSASKIKCAQRCPQEFHFRYEEKIPEPIVSPAQRLGKAVHAVLEQVMLKKSIAEALEEGRKGLLHDEERHQYDGLADAVKAFVVRIDAFRAKRRPHTEVIEHMLAIDAQLGPTSFVAPDAFFRGVLDAGFEWGEGELAVLDHKTGMRRPAGDHAEQLEAYATLAAAQGERVRRIWMGVHFVPDAAVEWSAPVPVEEVKASFVPRLLDQIELAAKSVEGAVEPRPGPYCEWCGYRPICPAMRAMARDEQSERGE